MQTISAALVGNPNAGKTSLFNLLTKQNQRVANWPGMTVEQKTGEFNIGKTKYDLIDLPGCYALNNKHQLDEKITTDFILESGPDLIINVINACQIPMHLYLTIQLLETNIPMIIVVNFIDQITEESKLDLEKLAKYTKCRIVPISARNNIGINKLKQALKTPIKKRVFSKHAAIKHQVSELCAKLPPKYRKTWIATNILEDNIQIKNLPDELKLAIKNLREQIAKNYDDEAEVIIADIRYNLAQKIINHCKIASITSKSGLKTNKIDKIFLHPFLGLPIFLAIMYFMFSTCLIAGSSIQAPFAAICELWLVKTPIAWVNTYIQLPIWLVDVLYNGVGVAITTTLSFIPPLLLLFITLSILEQSGYMARAAFITDKLMAMINLPGRAFVSLLIGFGCNVPAIMSTRTLQNHEDRILTAMMTPFMSCTARLALYVVLVQAFFKDTGGLVIFLIYLIGIVAGIITGVIIKRLLLSNDSPPLILELPDYIAPSIKYTWNDTTRRIKRFVCRTFKYMVIACSVLAILNIIPGSNNKPLLESIARSINILLQPMGINQDSWPTTIALILGTVAKEVMIGAFNTLGSHNFHYQEVITPVANIFSETASICFNWLKISSSSGLSQQISNIKALFHSQQAVISFLIFSCLYLPCFSTISALKKECGSKWSKIASIWSLLLAYDVATLYYQWATFNQHRTTTLAITLLIAAVTSSFIMYLKRVR